MDPTLILSIIGAVGAGVMTLFKICYYYKKKKKEEHPFGLKKV